MKEKDSDSDRTNSDDETSSNSPLVKPQSQLKKKPVEPKVSTKVVTIQREFETKFNSKKCAGVNMIQSPKKFSLRLTCMCI